MPAARPEVRPRRQQCRPRSAWPCWPIFAHYGGYRGRPDVVNGMNAAVIVGAVVVGIGALAAFAIPSRRRAERIEVTDRLPALEAA